MKITRQELTASGYAPDVEVPNLCVPKYQRLGIPGECVWSAMVWNSGTKVWCPMALDEEPFVVTRYNVTLVSYRERCPQCVAHDAYDPPPKEEEEEGYVKCKICAWRAEYSTQHVDQEEVPNLQIKRALQLGLAYGHEWAKVVQCALDRGICHPPKNWVAVAKIYGDFRYYAVGDYYPGLPVPELDSFGSIVHTTGTGRLTWEVTSKGEVYFTINRPPLDAGPRPCIEATISEDGDWTCRETGPAEERHWAAMVEALNAAGMRLDMRDLISNL